MTGGGGAQEGVPGQEAEPPPALGEGPGHWASVRQPGWKRHLVLPNAPGPGTKQPWYFVSVPCGHLQMTAWGGEKFWVSAEGPLPTSSEAGRSAQAELPQAAALLRTATGVFFRSMGGILSDTAFDPE